MFFIKKLILGLVAVILIYLGGNGTQSSNMLFQGGGFIGIIVGFVVLYIFAKMVWRAMGCLPVLLIICLIVGFVLYAIGAFNGGVDKVVPNVMNFLGTTGQGLSGEMGTQGAASVQLVEPENKETAPALSENFSDVAAPVAEDKIIPAPVVQPQAVATQAQVQQPIQQPQSTDIESGISKLISSLTGSVGNASAPSVEAATFNPKNYPAVYGVVRVINGDTLEMHGRYLRIFGIDAPESNQTCSDSKGRAYRCGQEAARWLKSWISGHELECHIIKQDSKGNMVATCALGQYDIGAALVNAGWAVVDLNQIDIYAPYERQAREDGRGLWQGQFYKPWDWREIQSKKPKIKVIKAKQPKKGLLDL